MNSNIATSTYIGVSSNQSLTYCNLFQPSNPYCGIFGAQEIVDVIFLMLLALVGTCGNLLVIFSIIYDKRVHHHGNVFIINVAVADFLVRFCSRLHENVIKLVHKKYAEAMVQMVKHRVSDRKVAGFQFLSC